MERITKIALVLLACALILGVGGAVMTADDGLLKDYGEIKPAVGFGGEVSFCDPLADPTCMPPKP